MKMNGASFHDARLHFRVKTRLIKCKMNQPSDTINKAHKARQPYGNVQGVEM